MSKRWKKYVELQIGPRRRKKSAGNPMSKRWNMSRKSSSFEEKNKPRFSKMFPGLLPWPGVSCHLQAEPADPGA
jgi:hypothetical protein